MKTSALDFLLIAGCIALLLVLSTLTASAFSLNTPYGMLLSVAIFLLSYGVFSMLLLAAIRRFRPYPSGRFKMRSTAFSYWKLNAVLVDLAHKALRPFATVFTESLIHAGFGVKMGKQTAIAGVLRDHPLLYVGDYATVGQNCVITAHAITHDEIVLAPVRIGRGAVVGINCVVMPGVELGEGAVLAPGGVATIGTKIQPYELWGGIPACKLKDLPRANR
jgi:acetyltransferase-like isoleucine patch superfamily enzyme